jgi:hypothetical protein
VPGEAGFGLFDRRLRRLHRALSGFDLRRACRHFGDILLTLGRFDARFRHRHRFPRLVEPCLGDDAFPEQLLLAFELLARRVKRGLRLGDLRFEDGDLRWPLSLAEIGELRLGARKLSLGLRDGGLCLRIVDAEGKRPGLDAVALLHRQLDDAAAGLRAEVDEFSLDIAGEHRIVSVGAAGGEEKQRYEPSDPGHAGSSRAAATMARTFCFSSVFTSARNGSS